MANPRGNPNWQPGHSGNPAGRPPKSRALTAILEAAGNVTVDADGKRTARKRVTATLLWELATTGRATFPDGTVLQADPADWLNAVKWLYQHIDGPPKAELDVTSNGETIKVYAGFNPEDV